ncbi:hypothetical protein VNO78_22014 [Psophocarpus tetragonolobus]|uniref:Uncharacterized protein n=1 Tax=Psophocarpus tetragonolobus TaxID=3891 RepID=A0AAN9XIT2_PSOTE
MVAHGGRNSHGVVIAIMVTMAGITVFFGEKKKGKIGFQPVSFFGILINTTPLITLSSSLLPRSQTSLPLHVLWRCSLLLLVALFHEYTVPMLSVMTRRRRNLGSDLADWIEFLSM